MGQTGNAPHKHTLRAPRETLPLVGGNREKLASCDHSPTGRGLHVLWMAAFYSAAIWKSSHKPLGSQASHHRPQEPGGTGLGGQALGQSSGAWTPQEGGSSDTSQNISWKVGIFLQV